MRHYPGIDQESRAARLNADPTSSRSSINHTRSMSYSSRTHSWSRRSRLLLLWIIGLALVAFFTVLFLGTQFYSLNRENQELRARLAHAEDELTKVTPELEKLRIDLEQLVRGRLPRLRELKYDQVLPLDQGYLKNVTFTEITNRNNRIHEYKLVVQNNTSATLWPEIQLLVFNEIGIQVGGSEIGTHHPNALKASSLDIGEARSYSAAIQLIDKEAAPAYFMIRIPEQANPLEVIREE